MALIYEKKKGIAYLTLNRPEARNSLDPETIIELLDAWADYRDDKEMRCAIITGAGDKAFCSGADLGKLIPLITGAKKAETEADKAVVKDPMGVAAQAMLRDFELYKPVIAAINGHAIAGGMEMLYSTDIRIAAEGSKLGLQEVKWAIFPGGGSTVRLPNQIPYARAMEVLLTGDQFSAESMLEYGFLNYVVPAEKVLEKAFEMAEKIAANGPVAVRAVRRSVREAIGVPEPEALVREGELSAPVYATEDAVEGPRAFMEKRQPVFKGR